MADINVERKTGTGWLWWVLGLIILALLIWWVAAPGDEDVAMVEPVAEQPIVPPLTTPEPIAEAPGVTIADVLGNPTMYVGTDFSQEVMVADVPTDRGFWIEDQGQRLFVVINESAQAGTADVQGRAAERPRLREGDMIQITEGTLQDPTQLQNVAGEVDQQTQQILAGQRVFLNTNVENIQQMQGSMP